MLTEPADIELDFRPAHPTATCHRETCPTGLADGAAHPAAGNGLLKTIVTGATPANSVSTTRAALAMIAAPTVTSTAPPRAARTATMTAPIVSTAAEDQLHLARGATAQTAPATTAETMAIRISGLGPVAGHLVAEATGGDETGAATEPI